jgi:hypothetical protein
MVKIDGNTGIDTVQNSKVKSADLEPSIALTGTPTAPTAPAGDSSAQIANTAFVTSAITANGNSKQNALGFTPVQQGTGIGQLGNTVKIGWSGSRIKATVDSTDLGNILTTANVILSGNTLYINL